MATLDIETLLGGVSADNPCGEDVEYDPAYLELEQVIQGKPEAQYGDTVIEAVGADWKQAETLAVGLLRRSLDLRVAVYLSRTLLNRSGVAGFADGLALIDGMIQRYWPTLYPQLDPDDDNDPTARVNALVTLMDSSGALRDFREAPLAASRTAGVLRWRDVEYVNGEATPPEGTAAMPMSTLDAIITDAHDDAVASHAALEACVNSFTSIETTLTAQVGISRAADFSALTRLLRQAAYFLAEHLGVGAPGGETDAAAGAGGGVAGGAGGGATPLTGDVNSRADVMKAIDRICAYYERQEPTSPIPMLLQRARRLVDKSFLEIIEELVPDAVRQVREVGGVKD